MINNQINIINVIFISIKNEKHYDFNFILIYFVSFIK